MQGNQAGITTRCRTGWRAAGNVCPAAVRDLVGFSSLPMATDAAVCSRVWLILIFDRVPHRLWRGLPVGMVHGSIGVW